MNDTMRTIKSIEESDLLIKGASEIIKTEAKKQKGWFLEMLLGTWGVSLLRNLLIGKGTIRVGNGVITKSWGWGTTRAGQDF